jgi:glycosyltransferase involved in cell wall biosynthesis
MKIVYIHQYYRTPEQSGGTRSWEFSRRLAARGHEVHVVTSDIECVGDAPSWRATQEAGATVHWANVPYGNAMSLARRAGAFVDFARRAAAKAASLPQDVVYATSTPLTVAVPGAYSAWRNRVPMVFEVRDLWPELPIALGGLRSRPTRAAAWKLEAWAYKRSAHIVALSPEMAASITTRFPGTEVTVIPNASDVEMFGDADEDGKLLRADYGWLEDRPMVFYGGTIGKANTTEYVARMAAALKRRGSDIQVAVVGKGGQENALRAEAERLDVLDDNFHMLGPVVKSTMPAWLAACDLAISTLGPDPALRASSPNKVFDAFAAGRPVAVNYQGWIAELLERTGAGVALPPDDPDRAAEYVQAFLGDPARVSGARRTARALAADEFNRDKLFDRLESVLRAAVSR